MKSLAIVALLFSLIFAQNDHDWQTVTTTNYIYDLTRSADEIWAATSGGILRFDRQSKQLRKYTNIGALYSVEQQAIEADNHQHIISGGLSGVLEVYDKNDGTWQHDFTLKGSAIRDLLYRNDTLWVAAGNGLGVFVWSGSKYNFIDFFFNFNTVVQWVNRVALFANHLWIGTDQGVLSAPADLSRYTINDPTLWNRFSTVDGLPDNTINDLQPYGGKLYVATEKGIASVDSQFEARTELGWYRNPEGQFYPVHSMAAGADKLYLSYSIHYYTFTDSARFVANQQAKINEMLVDENNELWFALDGSGLSNKKWTEPLTTDGPLSNIMRTVFKSTDGRIWASPNKYTRNSSTGFYVYSQNGWKNYFFWGPKWWGALKNVGCFYEDQFHNIWLGSWGGGIIVFRPDGQMQFFHNYEDNGNLILSTAAGEERVTIDTNAVFKGYFTGTKETPSYEVIPAITEGPQGRLWVVNYSAANNHLLAAIPYTDDGFIDLDKSHWEFFGPSDGIGGKEGLIVNITFDDWGRVVLGSLENGLFIFDYNGTLSDHSDDKVIHKGINDNLFSNNVYSVAHDREGIIWIGTAAGLNSYDGLNVYKHVGDPQGLNGPLENQINHIFVDDYNNKWFSTIGGLSILRANHSAWDANGWLGYSISNSGLVDNSVEAVYVDNKTSEALIGTERGLSVYRGSFAEIQPDFKTMVAGPNPFIIGREPAKFTIKNLESNSTVKIFTLSGRLVRELAPGGQLSDGGLQIDGGRAFWDGKDRTGALVASGIYVYFAFTQEKASQAGKIAVIRK